MMRSTEPAPQRVRRGAYLTPATVWDAAALATILVLMAGPTLVACVAICGVSMYGLVQGFRDAGEHGGV